MSVKSQTDPLALWWTFGCVIFPFCAWQLDLPLPHPLGPGLSARLGSPTSPSTQATKRDLGIVAMEFNIMR